MRRTWLTATVLFAISLSLAPCATASAIPAPRRAYLVLATGLAWSDVTPTATPTLWRLASEGAAGDLNAALRSPEPSEAPSAQEGALGISAGAWIAPDFKAPGAFDATETIQGSPATDAYTQRTGRSADGSAIVYVPSPATANPSSATAVASDGVAGTLGQAIENAGGATIAVGNSDAGDATLGFKLERPAALAAMDERGLVRFGDVSANLLAPSPDAPYGRRTDLAAFANVLRAAETSASALRGPSLIVLDPGDAYRAARLARTAGHSTILAQHAAAVRELDAVVALAIAHAGASDLVVVAGQAPPRVRSARRPGFSPVLVARSGLHGYLTSGSTHRSGIVTNPDVTATLLQALGLEHPAGVIGSPFTADPAPGSAASRIAFLSALNTTAVAQNVVRTQFQDGYVALFVLAVGLAGLFAGLRSRIPAHWRLWCGVALGALCIALLCLPIGGWLMFLHTPNVSSPAKMRLSLLEASGVPFLATALVWRWGGRRLAILVPLLVTVVVLVGDQLLGAPLSRTNLLGYSPLDSARYYGIGNEAAALLLGSTLAGMGLLVDLLGDTASGRLTRRVGLPALGALVVGVCAAPFLGANVGVAIWGTVGVVVAWALVNGRRITFKTALVTLLIVVLAVAAFAAIDVFGSGPKTHIARALTSAEQGGVSPLWTIVTRKAETNARVLLRSRWSLLLVVTIAFLALLRVLPGRPLAPLLAKNPAFGAVLWAALAAGLFGFLTEDTGINVPAWIWLPVGVAAVWLTVAPDDVESAPETVPASL